MKLIFDYKFRFYTSKMNEICLHCHLLYFSSIILSFGQCVRWARLSIITFIIKYVVSATRYRTGILLKSDKEDGFVANKLGWTNYASHLTKRIFRSHLFYCISHAPLQLCPFILKGTSNNFFLIFYCCCFKSLLIKKLYISKQCFKVRRG